MRGRFGAKSLSTRPTRGKGAGLPGSSGARRKPAGLAARPGCAVATSGAGWNASPGNPMPPRILRTVLVAASRYDAEGVMVYRVGIVQNGSRGAIGGLIEDWNARHAAGDRAVRNEVFDEKVRTPVTA